jgi:hypothetical protein
MSLRTFLMTLTVSLAMPSSLSAADRYVRTSAELQTALVNAQPGDRILLEPGVTYLGNFVLPVKSGTTFITIRSATPDAQLPPAGTRISPSHSALLPRLQSPNSVAVLKTAAGAHHWRLQYLEFGPNMGGYGDILLLGNSAQTTLASVPYALELHHVYIHGDPLLGQKRGIALNAGGTVIRDSHISDCKAVGQDAQAIAGWNGPGPYWIENNYLEGAGENFLLGGADPAIPGLVPTDVTFRRNYVSKPVGWQAPIVATPVGVMAGNLPGGGILPVGTYAYRIVARRPSGQGTTARSTASVQATAAVTSAGSAVQIQWSAVPGATEYLVYGRTPGAQGMYWRTTTTSVIDTGAAGTAGAVPTTAGTVWTVKNLFELKNARKVIVEWNTFENNWLQAQVGYAILFTARNSGGSCTWCVVEDVEFRYNIVRHSSAAVNVLGDCGSGNCAPLQSLRIRHNLFYDINQARWGGNGFGFLIGEQPRDVIIDHNTIDHSGPTVLYAYGGTPTDRREILGMQFTNNLARHSTYGISGAGVSYGYPAISAYFPDGFITANLLAGGDPSKYPPGNFFTNNFDTQFVDKTNGNYRLIPTSPYNSGSTDGLPLGADMGSLMLYQPPPPGTVAPPPPPATAPVPVATSLSPASVTAGAAAFNLTVNGSSFVPSAIVRWKGADRPTTFVSATQLRASIAAADIATAGTASVTVFTPSPGGGTSAPLTFTIAAAPATAPVPVATSLSPASATAGTAAFNLTVNGSNFVPSSIVRWKGADRPTTFVSATQLRASISAADIATAGTASVTVFTPSPGGGTSAPLTFTIATAQGPRLTVSATTVARGGSVTVTLTGGQGGMGDWLAFALSTAPNTSYYTYTYVGLGVKSRTWTITAPTTPGVYEFRLFFNDGYVRAATSPPVTVQ